MITGKSLGRCRELTQASSTSAVGGDGALTFKAKPDFEARGRQHGQRIRSNGGRPPTATATGTMDVKVTVTNEEDWSGHAVADSAACWSPGDGQPDRPGRQHIRPQMAVVPGYVNTTENATDGTPFDDATSDTYTPTEDDDWLTAGNPDGEWRPTPTALAPGRRWATKQLTHRWTRTAGTSRRRSWTRTRDDGIQNETATREVEENTKR